jgi:hypothetical protein
MSAALIFDDVESPPQKKTLGKSVLTEGLHTQTFGLFL